MKVIKQLSLIFMMMVSLSAFALEDDRDELVMKRKRLMAINNTTDQLQKEIADLERVSSERAQNIKTINAKIQAAKRAMERTQAELAKVKGQTEVVEKTEVQAQAQLTDAEAKLNAVNQELAKVKADYARAEARHKSELAKIDQDRKEEQKRRAELNQRVANFESYLKKNGQMREQAREQVDNLYQGNERLYEKLKGRQPTEAPTIAPVAEMPEQ